MGGMRANPARLREVLVPAGWLLTIYKAPSREPLRMPATSLFLFFFIIIIFFFIFFFLALGVAAAWGMPLLP